MENFSFKIKLTDDPYQLRMRAVELHDSIESVTKFYDSAKYMVNAAESELSRFRDMSLIDADKDPYYRTKSVDIKTAYGKSHLKYKIKIESPISEDDYLTSVEGEFTYDELKNVITVLQFKADRLESKFKELMKAIEICNYFPVKNI